MVSDGTNTYEYDAEGNLTAEDMADDTFIWYAWDQRNRLVSVTYADVYGTPVSGVNYTYEPSTSSSPERCGERVRLRLRRKLAAKIPCGAASGSMRSILET